MRRYRCVFWNEIQINNVKKCSISNIVDVYTVIGASVSEPLVFW